MFIQVTHMTHTNRHYDTVTLQFGSVHDSGSQFHKRLIYSTKEDMKTIQYCHLIFIMKNK